MIFNMNLTLNKLIERVARQTLIQVQTLSLSTNTEIKIPKRIERGPTEILEALESTISRDPTAPHYKFIDDPFFIPNNLSKKRMYSLAKESGKKAAMWIKEQHPDLLYSELSEPLVEAFLPEPKYENASDVSEDILIKTMNLGRLDQAFKIYKLLEGNVSKETKQLLLEMFCYFNSTNDIREEFTEERSYQQKQVPNQNMWINNVEIENLFGELSVDEEMAASAYNALICGTAKYLQTDKTWSLYSKSIEKKLPLTLRTYNHMIQIIPFLRDSDEERKAMLLSFLDTMVTNNIKPNMNTLNSCLKTLKSISDRGVAKEFALQLINEFKSIGIEPGLGTYDHLLSIFCSEAGVTSYILSEILDELENKELQMQDIADVNFFVNAMEVASKHLHDINIGDRIHKLLTTKKNYKFIGSRLNEGIYYRHYLLLLLSSETIDEFMKVYENLVPHIYVPEPAVMKDIVLMLEINDVDKVNQYIPKILSHMITFDMLERQSVIVPLLKIMCNYCKPLKDSALEKQYNDFCWTLWNNMQENTQKRLQRSMWPASVFADMSVILLRGQEFEKMIEIFSFLLKSQSYVIGCIHSERLGEILAGCLVRGHSEGAMLVAQYAFEYGFPEAVAIAKKIKNDLVLTQKEEDLLVSLAGEEMLQAETN